MDVEAWSAGDADSHSYRDFDTILKGDPRFDALKSRHDEDLRRIGAALKDPMGPPTSTAIGPFDEFLQMGNPIRVITSGVERETQRPFFASGKWRYVDRVTWWREYDGKIPVLFGHYWRWWDPSVHPVLSKGEPHLFDDDPVGPFMADHHTAFCIGFSVGSRYKQKLHGHEPPYHGRLAAMRWPERELVFDGNAPSHSAVSRELRHQL